MVLNEKEKIMKQLDLKKLNPVYDLDIRPITSMQPSYFFGEKAMYDIDFDVILDNGIKLQRDYVWTLEQKRNLIVGMLCGSKLPPFYVVVYTDERSDFKIHRVVDGKQRLSTIRDYINNEFGILFEGVEYFFDDLNSMQKYTINCYSLDVHIVYEYFDQKIGDKGYVKLFNFVNFGGTPQEREHMTMLEQSLK